MIGGLGVQELLIVLVIALVLFGGKRLPEIGQSLGKALRGFKEGSEKALDDTSERKGEPAETGEKQSAEQEVPHTPPSEKTEGQAEEPEAVDEEEKA
ncbi:MAG: twin-arginine translocase TatA/TatE family subunit [bacterium]|nr:MAG: twin-arginine translocase TatA/TatE family subunit [bacterium]